MAEKKVETKAEAHVDAAPADDTSQVLPRDQQEHPNETIPGGVYLAADGKTLTNCWNQRIDPDGKVLDPTPLLHGEW